MSTSIDTPTLIRDDDHARIWYKQYATRAMVFNILRTPLVRATMANHIKAELYCSLVNKVCSMMDVIAEVSVVRSGLEILVIGDHHTQISSVYKSLISIIQDSGFVPKHFEKVKNNLMKYYRDQQPHDQVDDMLGYITTGKSWISEQYAAELESIKENDVAVFIRKLWQAYHLDSLVIGNFSKEGALDMVKCAIPFCSLQQSLWETYQRVKLPLGINHIYERELRNPQIAESCIGYYLVIDEVPNSIMRANLRLLEYLITEPASAQLQSKERLGSVVWSNASVFTMQYRIVIQSKRKAQYLENRIDSFLGNFAHMLEDMAEEKFENSKCHMIEKGGLHPIRLWWDCIGSGDYDFLQHETDAIAMGTLTKTNLIAFYRQYIDPASRTRAKVSIHLNALSADPDKANGEEAIKGEPVYITYVPQFTAQCQVINGPI